MEVFFSSWFTDENMSNQFDKIINRDFMGVVFQGLLNNTKDYIMYETCLSIVSSVAYLGGGHGEHITLMFDLGLSEALLRTLEFDTV